MPRPKATHCPQGHAYDEANTYQDDPDRLMAAAAYLLQHTDILKEARQ